MLFTIYTRTPSLSPEHRRETIDPGELPAALAVLTRIESIVDLDLDELGDGAYDDALHAIRYDLDRAADFDADRGFSYSLPDGGKITAERDRLAERNAETDAEYARISADPEAARFLSHEYPTIIQSVAAGLMTASLWMDAFPFDRDEDTGETGGQEGHEVDETATAAYVRMATLFVGAAWDMLPAYALMREYDPGQGDVWSYLGHDLWGSANGHGTGFWDRGLAKLGDDLNRLADRQPFAGMGDDLRLYVDSQGIAGL